MGKASKRKSDRRTGAGPSRAETESKASQEQVRRRLTAALSEPGQLSDMLRQAAAAQAAAGDAVTERSGDVTPDPADPVSDPQATTD